MKKPKKANATTDKWQTHVYLTEAEHKHLVQVAGEQCRSPTSQIQYFIRQALAAYDKGQR